MSSGTPSVSADDELLALAFYIAVDVSISMDVSGALEEANGVLPKILDAIGASPSLSDIVRLGMIDFSDDARVVLRLDDVRNIESLPHLTPRGGTSYAAAFRMLRNEIEADRQQLKSDGFKLYRPTVFFISDGAPTDPEATTKSAFDDLVDPSFRHRPNIVPFGFGEATKELMDKWVYPTTGKNPMRSFVVGPEVSPAAAVKSLADKLVQSIVASAQSVDQLGSGGGFVPPDDDDDDNLWE